MPDQLHLSLWLRGYREETMLAHFERLISIFPFSQLRPGVSALKVYALEFVEPPVLEHIFAGEVDLATVIGMCREFEHPDSAYVVEGWWESFQYQTEWKLGPSRITLNCFGPEFENDEGDHLRIDLGLDDAYLPRPDVPDSARMIRSNLKGLARLITEFEQKLPVERKHLWSESEENFGERLESAFDQ